jgi:hypothetical protein
MSVIVLVVIILSIIVLGVIMLSVVASTVRSFAKPTPVLLDDKRKKAFCFF